MADSEAVESALVLSFRKTIRNGRSEKRCHADFLSAAIQFRFHATWRLLFVASGAGLAPCIIGRSDCVFLLSDSVQLDPAGKEEEGSRVRLDVRALRGFYSGLRNDSRNEYLERVAFGVSLRWFDQGGDGGVFSADGDPDVPAGAESARIAK